MENTCSLESVVWNGHCNPSLFHESGRARGCIKNRIREENGDWQKNKNKSQVLWTRGDLGRGGGGEAFHFSQSAAIFRALTKSNVNLNQK